MKTLLLTFSILAVGHGFSQDLTPVFEDTTLEGSMVKLTSFNYYASNAFTNEFTDKFLFGGEVTREIKDRVTDNLGRVNSLGGEIEQRIDFYAGTLTPLRNKNYGMHFSISDNHLISSNMSSDLYTTIMYGNADNLNDTMDFSFSHFQYLHYQKFGIGLFDKRTLSSVQLNYVAGANAIEGRLSNSWMYSAQDSITLMLQGAGDATEDFSPYFGFQGHGFAVDLNYNFLFDTKKGNPQIINLKINNIGLIAWNKTSRRYSVDSTVTYSGFDIQDFINQPEGSSNNYNFQDTLGIVSGTGPTVSSLPIEFVIQKLPRKESQKKLQYILGFKTILTSDYFPYFFGGVYYAPIQNFSGSTRLSYGGFGGLQWGLDLNYWVNGNIHLGLGTFDMIGNISKKYGFGRSLNFSAHFKF